MQRALLLFEHSPAWLIPGLLVALGLAALVYYQTKGPWGPTARWTLALLRVGLVFLLLFLLLGPILRQVENTTEKPVIVLAVDNSQSMAMGAEETIRRATLSEMVTLAGFWTDKGYEVRAKNFQGDLPIGQLPNLTWEANTTPLDKWLMDIRGEYEGLPLQGVVLVSDGIFNSGSSPTYSGYPYPIHTVGLGDTIPKKDLAVSGLRYNRLTYQGNKFPIIAEIKSTGFKGADIQIDLVQAGRVIATKPVRPIADNRVMEVEFVVEAENFGLQRFEVRIRPQQGEFTLVNNLARAYVEVVEGKEKILLVAPAPHPDIKALKAAVESNANYELHVHIPGLHPWKDDTYSLVIYLQSPDNRGITRQVSDLLKNRQLPALYIFGSQMQVTQLNTLPAPVQIESYPYEFDKVTGAVNVGFTGFRLSEELLALLPKMPPLAVPFGKYKLAPGAEVLLYQRVGSVDTDKPLVALHGNSNPKSAMITGEGLWKWRMQEYAQNEHNKGFNELITKLVQFLTTRDDKRKFRVYPLANEFEGGENVVFEAEVYNDLFERTYGHTIDLKVQSEEGESSGFSWTTTEANSRFRLSGIGEGIYTWEATATVSGKKETAKGEFIVNDLLVEQMQLTADFDLLRELASKSNGQFVVAPSLEALREAFPPKAQGKIYSSETYLPAIHLGWLLVVLLAIVTTEWFIRKYQGGY